MKEAESNSSSEAPTRTALRRYVVQRLLIKIIRGELGPGSRLIANGLAVQLGMSATPVREAMVELEQTGIIGLTHHRGAVVNPFGRNELRDFYHVRRLLLCEAVRLACGQIDPSLIDELHGELQRVDGASHDGHLAKDLFGIDQSIRQLLVDRCSNKWLVADLGRYESVDSALREIVGGRRVAQRDVFLPAGELVAALQDNHADRSHAAMNRHVGVVACTVEEMVFDGKP